MKLSELTKDQAIEIARLAYGDFNRAKTDKWIQEDKGFEYNYYPENPEWYEDGYEHSILTFYAITFGNTVDEIQLLIYPNLNVFIGYVRPNKEGVPCIHNLPQKNQHRIQLKFIEWNLKIDEHEYRS